MCKKLFANVYICTLCKLSTTDGGLLDKKALNEALTFKLIICALSLIFSFSKIYFALYFSCERDELSLTQALFYSSSRRITTSCGPSPTQTLTSFSSASLS